LDGLLAVTLFALDPPFCDIFHCQLEVAWHELYDCNERNWVSTIGILEEQWSDANFKAQKTGQRIPAQWKIHTNIKTYEQALIHTW
jgi:hypothetical protein